MNIWGINRWFSIDGSPLSGSTTVEFCATWKRVTSKPQLYRVYIICRKANCQNAALKLAKNGIDPTWYIVGSCNQLDIMIYAMCNILAIVAMAIMGSHGFQRSTMFRKQDNNSSYSWNIHGYAYTAESIPQHGDFPASHAIFDMDGILCIAQHDQQPCR